MKSSNKSITIITNLYPLPWEPNRATFNRQQFSQLEEDYNVSFLVPVAFTEWFANKSNIQQSEKIRYVPYFYTPKIGRRLYSVFLFFSILLHSGFWLKRKKSDILMASWAFPEAVATNWLSKLFKARFFFKVHGSDINLHSEYPARSKQIVTAAANALGVLSVSKALKEKMISMGIDRQKIKVVYNGVNHQLFNTPQKPTFDFPYVLYVGNLKETKGVCELLTGFAMIHEKHPELNLVFAGPGKLKAALQKQANGLTISNKVHFLGGVNHEQLPSLMQDAQITILPSYNEGVPNVLLESMACGTPVLATRVGGIPEIIKESVCGEIISVKDASAVANGLNSMLSKQWDKNQIIEHSQQFSWTKNKSELMSFLE